MEIDRKHLKRLAENPETSTNLNSKPLLLNVLVEGNKFAISGELARYRERGMISYRKILEIPLWERIPALLEFPGNRPVIGTALVASLKSAFSQINLSAPMNEEQIVELAAALMESASEDNLGLEDILLFLQDLLMGKMGTLFNRMDSPTFFESFEIYRQRRHVEMRNIRDEEAAQFRALPINDRFVYDSVQEEKDKTRKAIASYFPPKPTADGNP